MDVVPHLDLTIIVSKHFVIFLSFPSLIACLLCCLLMSFFLACFVVRDLCRSGCKQTYYLTPLSPSPSPSIFIFPLPTILCLTQVTKDFEKTTKYSQLRLELTNRYPEYKVNQYNLIVDVVGGCSKEVEQNVKELVGDKCESIMRQMQKVILSSSWYIARMFKLSG